MEGYTLVASKPVVDGVAEFDDLEHTKQYRVKIVADDDNGFGTVAESYMDCWTQAPLKQDPAFSETNGQALKFSNITETSFNVSYSFTHPYAIIEHFIFLYDTLDNLISTFDMGTTDGGMVSTDRSITITNLTSQTSYNVRVACADRYGNAILHFGSITMPDLTIPVLSETSAVKTGTTTAEVKWKVTDLSDVTVTVRHFESATLDLGIPIGTTTSKVKDALQTLQLTNLKANTDYTVYIQAKDETNPETPVIIHTFKTDTDMTAAEDWWGSGDIVYWTHTGDPIALMFMNKEAFTGGTMANYIFIWRNAGVWTYHGDWSPPGDPGASGWIRSPKFSTSESDRKAIMTLILNRHNSTLKPEYKTWT